MTNAQTALQAAATVLGPILATPNPRGGGMPFGYEDSRVIQTANAFKVWLDKADADDTRAAKIAAKGTIDERVDALESQVFDVSEVVSS